jgi:tetratricopeptide (TPR) repeat protein
MDPTTLAAIYAVLAAFGLVVTDTYVNQNTMYLDTTVAESVKEQGYEKYVVDGIFISEVKKITKTPTLIAVPSIQSSKTKPISAALAEFANLEGALVAMQSLMGIVPPKMVTSVIVEDPTKRVQVVQNGPDGRVAEYVVAEDETLKLVLTGYDPKSGYFDIQVSAHSKDDDFDHLIRDAAFQAVLKLDPYLALLYDLNGRAVKNEDVDPSRVMIDKEINDLPGSLTHDHRALLENLRGIMGLLDNDVVTARADFQKAIESDSQLSVGYLNLAFLDVHEDRYEDALKTLEKVIYPTYWPMTGNRALLASAYTIKGVAETELERFKAAEQSFRHATWLNPRSSEVYVYWSRMLNKSARSTEAKQKMHKAKENSKYFENYPEMALLYFWLTEEGNQPLARRTKL